MGNRSEHRNEGMNRWPRWGRAVLMAAAMVLAPMAAAAEQACAPDRVTLRGDWGTATFRVEIADDAAERAQGLMYRDQMDRGAGMLFVYPRPQVAIAFWMRNTRIPLDIIFADKTGVVQQIAREDRAGNGNPSSRDRRRRRLGLLGSFQPPHLHIETTHGPGRSAVW